MRLTVIRRMSSTCSTERWVITYVSSSLSVLTYLQVNLQHGLILEHQQAFQDYKAQTASKLKDLEDLQERVSRLTLEKGNFRGEIDKYTQLLEREQITKVEDLKKAEVLQEELESLVASKKQLLTEVDSLQKTISGLLEKMQDAAQELTDRFTTELKEKTDLLAKETAKAASLNTLINNLKDQEGNVKMEIAKVKAESKLMNDKYNRIAAEHSQAFSVRKDIVLVLHNS
jgi:chromosome segregation ATPase